MSSAMKPTPSTLEEAIANGIEDYCGREDRNVKPEKIVKNHVRDFLAQKFAVPLLEVSFGKRILEKLWERITGEKLK